MYLLQISNNTWGFILFSALMIAVFAGYVWLGKETAKQDNKERNYPVARKPTKEEIKEVNRLLNHEGN